MVPRPNAVRTVSALGKWPPDFSTADCRASGPGADDAVLQGVVGPNGLSVAAASSVVLLAKGDAEGGTDGGVGGGAGGSRCTRSTQRPAASPAHIDCIWSASGVHLDYI